MTTANTSNASGKPAAQSDMTKVQLTTQQYGNKTFEFVQAPLVIRLQKSACACHLVLKWKVDTLNFQRSQEARTIDLFCR